MSVVMARSVVEALDEFNKAVANLQLAQAATSLSEIDDLELGRWVSTYVRLPKGYDSEISSPFLTAYNEIQSELYRLVALVRTGNGDIRGLSQDDLDQYQLRVRVDEGSSVFTDNLPKMVESLASELVGKMTGPEAVITIVGLGLLLCSTYGLKVFLETRKEERLESTRSDERVRAIAAMEFATRAQMEQAAAIRTAMENAGDIANRALAFADRTQEALLKGASKTNETVIGDVHLTREEAKILTTTARKRSSIKIVDQEMKVVDVNTSDPLHWSVVLEDLDSARQFKMAFRDALIEEAEKLEIRDALTARGSLWFRLKAKYSGDELQSYEIMKVIEEPLDAG